MTDVYISHFGERSQSIAQSISDKLTSEGISCFSTPAQDGESAKNALMQCRVFVIVLNQAASYSKQVLDEISTACVRLHGGENISILPFQISDETVSDDAMSYIGRLHWTEAFDGDMDKHILAFVSKIKDCLKDGGGQTSAEPAERHGGNLYTAASEKDAPKKSKTGVIVSMVALSLLLTAVGLFYAFKGQKKADTQAQTDTTSYEQVAARYGIKLDGNEAWEENGVTVIGKKVNGTAEGNCIKLCPNGSTYIGAVSGGIAEGYGIFTFADSGSVYYGMWSHNLRNGQGKFVKKDGETWEGTWVDDYEEGDFTITYADGTVEKYIFKDGNGALVE